MLLPLGMLSRAPPLPHPGNLSYKVVSSLYQRACCVNSTRLSNRKRPQKSSPVVATSRCSCNCLCVWMYACAYACEWVCACVCDYRGHCYSRLNGIPCWLIVHTCVSVQLRIQTEPSQAKLSSCRFWVLFGCGNGRGGVRGVDFLFFSMFIVCCCFCLLFYLLFDPQLLMDRGRVKVKAQLSFWPSCSCCCCPCYCCCCCYAMWDNYFGICCWNTHKTHVLPP